MLIKRHTSLLLVIIVMFVFCSCSNPKYEDMRNYLNSNTCLQVVSIDDWVFNEDNKSVLLYIELPRKSNPSLEELDELRIALNEYMQREGGFLEQGWQVSIYIDEQMNGSSIGERYAIMANFEQGRMSPNGDSTYDTETYLNTFWFRINSADLEYISSLYDIENMLIAGDYSESDEDMLNNTIDEIKELVNLQTLRVYSCWYEEFNSANLNCKVIETDSGKI